jgi:AsmA-like C-terminal region/AsmA family
MKKYLKITAISLAVLLAAAVALPFLFKDKIVTQIKSSINEKINAKVDFSDADISLLRGFPNLNVRINDLSVVGTQEFEGVSLLNSKYFDLNIDFWSIISGSETVAVKSIHLEQPSINILVLPNEKANYSITKPDNTPKDIPVEKATSFKLALQKYSITDGTLTYDDRSMGFFTQLSHVDHTGKGEFTTDIFDLATKTLAQETTVRYGGVTYIDQAKGDADVTVNADMKNFKFTLKENTIKLNDFLAKGEGWVQIGEQDIKMDVNFGSPQSDFKNLLSILPSAYSKDFSNVQASGKFNCNGLVKGTYNDTQYPAINFNLGIDGAAFKYPSLPLGVSNIATKIDIKSPEGKDFDLMTVDIPTFGLNVGQYPFGGYFHLKTPVSDPDIDTKIDGKLNLADLAKAFPIQSVSDLSGLITANVLAKTKMSYIDKKLYDKINMAGGLQIQNMNARPEGKPKVHINDLKMNFTPNFVGIDDFNAQLGKSDIQANGKIDNILAYFSPNRTMKGNLTFRSNYFDAGEWMTESTKSDTKTASNEPQKTNNPKGTVSNEPKTASSSPVFDRFDFSLDAKIGNLKYNTYNLLNTIAIGHFTPNVVTFSDMSTKIGESDLKVKGDLSNVFGYLFDNEVLKGVVNINSNYMNMNQFMTPEPAKGTTQSSTSSTPNPANVEPLRIPKSIDMTINADIKKVIYTNMDMDNLNGQIAVNQGIAKLVNTKASTLGGTIGLNGLYNSTLEKPKFQLDYDIKNFDFQKAFNTFNTFAVVAPLGKYMTGRFNSTLSMTGDLGKDMMPDFNTLTANGFLHTLQALISGIKPIQDISNTLNINDLVPLAIKDSKNWFEVKNGALVITPFDFKVKDLNFNMAGSHSFSSEMNYVLKTKVPRKLLEKNAVSAAANTGYNLILKEASKYGVNIQNGEFVNCQFNFGGTMLSPKVGFKLLGTDGQSIQQTAENQATAVLDKAKDSLKTRVNEEVKKAEDKAREVAQKAKDSIANVAQREADKAIEKGKDAVKEQVGKIDKQLGDKAGEVLGDKAGDKAKDALEKGKGAIDKLFKKKN